MGYFHGILVTEISDIKGSTALTPVTLAALSLSGDLRVGVAASGTIAGAANGATIAGNIPGITVDSLNRTYSGTPTSVAGVIAGGLVQTLAGALNSPLATAVTILPALPTVSLAADVSKAEGNSGANLYTFTVSRSSAIGAVSVTWTFSPGTTSAADYTGGAFPAGGSVALADGVASATFTVSVNGDTDVEPDESFTVAIAAPAGYALGAKSSATGTIVNDDASATPTVTLSADISKAEGNSGASLYTYTVTRSATAGAVNVAWSFAAGGTSSADFTGGTLPTGGNVALADGVASGTFTVSVNGDADVEPDETFTVSIAAPAGYALGAKASATGVIVNDDSAPLPTVALAADVSKAEGNSGPTLYTFTVTRSSSTGAVSVPWGFAPGGTTAADFTGGALPTGGSVAMADGVASGTFTVSVNGDTDAEPDENFTVTISAPSGYALGAKASAIGGIVNDDAAPAVPISSVDANGWTAQWASGTPPTFAPDSSPQTLAVTYPGFDASGAATTITDEVTITRRLRQAYPNQASFTLSTVVLSEYVPAGATIAGANTAGSIIGYPKVIARWAMPPKEALAGPLVLEVVAFQKYGRSNLPVRAVRITGTPTTGSPVTKLASYAKSARYGDSLPVWQATFSPSDFPGNDGADVRWDFEAIPWIGTASEKRSTVGIAFPSISTVGPLVSRQAPVATLYAYVSLTGNNGTAVTHATRATAKASPYATVAGAIEALRTASGGDLSTCAIVFMAGTHTWPGAMAAGGTRTALNGWLTLEGDPDEADPFNSVTLQTSATTGPFLFNTAAGAWSFARFRNMGVTTASGAGGFVSGNGRLYVWLDNVKFTCNSGTGAWAAGTRFIVTGGSGPVAGKGYSNSAANMIFDLVRGLSSNRVVQGNAVLSTKIDGSALGGNALMLGDATNPPASNLIAHNVEVTSWLGDTAACFSFASDAAAPAAYRDIAIVQVAVACSNSAVSPLFAVGENNSIDVDNLLLDYLTVTPGTNKEGGRINIHNDPVDVPTTGSTDQVAYTHMALKRSDCAWVAVKDDVYHGANEGDTAAGLLTAGWAKANGVGWRDNVSRYTPDNFPPDFFGLNGARGGGVATPRLIPAGAKYQALTWDIDGVLRKTNGAGKAGARDPLA